MSKKTLPIAALSLCLVFPTSVHAEDAEALNDKGKSAFAEQRYQEAYRWFVAATQADPQARYYFNVCYTLSYLQRIADAITACEQVKAIGSDPALTQKTDSLLQNLRAQPVSSSDPQNASRGEPITPTPGAAPAVAAEPLDLDAPSSAGYEWSLGGKFAGVGNHGLGSCGLYDDSGNDLALFGNFILLRDHGLGLQAQIAWNNLPSNTANVDSLRIYDVGGGVFWSRPFANAWVFEPLLGTHLSFMQPSSSSSQVFVALGLRAEASVGYAFGDAKQHLVSLAPALTLYSAAVSDNTDIMADDFGLDSPGSTLALSLGYQYRFSEPFGIVPLLRLE